MSATFSRRMILFSTLLLSGAGGDALAAQLPAASPLVRAPVNDAVRVALTRDLPGALAKSTDEGALRDNVALPSIRLTLTRPPDRQAALDQLTRDQHVRAAAAFRRWLKPADLRGYGPAQADIDKVVAWLIGRGLTVNSVSPSGMSIDFGGSAGRVAAAFHTSLHNVAFHGEAHVSNVTAPTIPAALAPVVTGVTLSNFFPKPAIRRVTPSLTVHDGNATFYAVAPPDFATIYNINPLRGSNNAYGQPITGAGATLAMVEETQIQSSDWATFRKAFGLSSYKGTLTQVNPNCASPGTNGDESEAALDTEWSAAVAPDASIIEASCAGKPPYEFGVLTTLQNLVEKGTSATIFSISYEADETELGYSFETAWVNLLEEGASEGKSIFVASGDNGTSADRNVIDGDGLFVNGFADSAYNVSVGGTDFYDTALGENTQYWRQNDNKIGGSALSYVPEIPWDNSCASPIIFKYLGATGAIPFCNSGSEPVQNGVGGSGSQSVYYRKPDWQLTSVLGMPDDGVRDQPDVSLFAANGEWSHFLVYCMSDPAEGGSPCDYKNINDLFGNAAGGTSFASPAFAGIQALVQQTFNNQPLGNPAPEYYKIAAAQFSTPLGHTKCNASLGNQVSPACAFYHVTAGTNAEPCYKGTEACITTPASTQGIGVVGATIGGKTIFAYPATTGYNLATGLGSVNVTNLLYNYY